jgi:preprotein translocase subunit SecD
MNILASLLLVATADPAIEAAAAPTTAAIQRSGLWIADTEFLSADIASAEQSFDAETAAPNVVITLTEPGRVKFARLQQELVEQVLEIRIDGELVASPFLLEPIAGNQMTIEGSFTVEEAKALARRIAPLRR